MRGVRAEGYCATAAVEVMPRQGIRIPMRGRSRSGEDQIGPCSLAGCTYRRCTGHHNSGRVQPAPALELPALPVNRPLVVEQASPQPSMTSCLRRYSCLGSGATAVGAISLRSRRPLARGLPTSPLWSTPHPWWHASVCSSCGTPLRAAPTTAAAPDHRRGLRWVPPCRGSGWRAATRGALASTARASPPPPPPAPPHPCRQWWAPPTTSGGRGARPQPATGRPVASAWRAPPVVGCGRGSRGASRGRLAQLLVVPLGRPP